MKIYADTGLLGSDVLAAMSRGRLIESGYWPGIEKAFEEADKAGEVSGLESGETAEEETSLQEPLRVAANDKLTDPEIDTVVDAVTEGDETMRDRVKRLIAWAMGRA